MKHSIWRSSHLILAVASLIFILTAAITGAILSFDPLLKTNKISVDLDQPLYQSIESLKKANTEVFKLEKNNYGEWIAEVMDDDGNNQTLLVDPISGENFGKPKEQSAFFKNITGLHRSLFMGTFGRWLVTIISICLALITITGLFIVAKKVGGWLKFFSKLKNEDNAPYYHTVLGRYSFLFILIISFSGSILFLDDYWKLDSDAIELEAYIEDANQDYEEVPLNKISIFNTPLSEITKVEFPFTDDVEDAFIIHTKNESKVVNQYTGEVYDRIENTDYSKLEQLLFALHTGQNFGYWPIILLFTCLNILYFIYSGLVITLKKQKSRFKNKIAAKDAEIVLFVGSENGSTWLFAKAFHDEMIAKGSKIRSVGMDKIEHYPNAKQFIFFCSTYGNGEAPTNAQNFTKQIPSLLNKDITYSILGFGSKQYPEYCKYAFDLQHSLQQTHAKELTAIQTIDNKNVQQFLAWIDGYSKITNLENFKVKLEFKKPKTHKFNVLNITKSSVDSEYFIIELDASKKVKSGDLISILAPNTSFVRQYSIAKTSAKTIVLYVKKHEFGICSSYLSTLKKGDQIRGWIDVNESFRYDNSKPAICIGNGTGLAPFIGFEREKKNQSLEIIWGTKTKDSFNLITSIQALNTISWNVCFSRETETPKIYATTFFINNIDQYAEKILNGHVLYICGALQMEQELKKALLDYAIQKGIKPEKLVGNIKSDCY